jgi:hypothetical protein
VLSSSSKQHEQLLVSVTHCWKRLTWVGNTSLQALHKKSFT